VAPTLIAFVPAVLGIVGIEAFWRYSQPADRRLVSSNHEGLAMHRMLLAAALAGGLLASPAAAKAGAGPEECDEPQRWAAAGPGLDVLCTSPKLQALWNEGSALWLKLVNNRPQAEWPVVRDVTYVDLATCLPPGTRATPPLAPQIEACAARLLELNQAELRQRFPALDAPQQPFPEFMPTASSYDWCFSARLATTVVFCRAPRLLAAAELLGQQLNATLADLGPVQRAALATEQRHWLAEIPRRCYLPLALPAVPPIATVGEIESCLQHELAARSDELTPWHWEPANPRHKETSPAQAGEAWPAASH